METEVRMKNCDLCNTVEICKEADLPANETPCANQDFCALLCRQDARSCLNGYHKGVELPCKETDEFQTITDCYFIKKVCESIKKLADNGVTMVLGNSEGVFYFDLSPDFNYELSDKFVRFFIGDRVIIHQIEDILFIHTHREEQKAKGDNNGRKDFV